MRGLSFFKVVAAIALVAVIAVSCGDDDDDSSAVEEPAAAEPSADPAVEEPAAEEPAAEEPADEEPAAPAGPQIVVGAPVCLTGGLSSTFKLAEAVNMAWEQWVNETQGGINGYPVDVVTRDTACDAATGLAEVRALVEEDGAIALFHADALTLNTVKDYVEENQIPVIGFPVATGSSPMYFMAGAGLPEGQFGYPILADLSGSTTMGAVVCAEIPQCADGPNAYTAVAEELGVDFVGTFQVAGAAPSYTAECLAMKDEGAQALAVATANATAVRLMADCSAQDFDPYYILSGQTVDASFAEIPGLSVYSNGYTLPWFVDDGPMAGYTEAMSTYQPNADQGAAGSIQWASLELFRKAMENTPAEPTNLDVLDGLYSLDGETLGGMLAKPVTFLEGEPPPVNTCFFPIALIDGDFSLPEGLDPVCYGDA